MSGRRRPEAQLVSVILPTYGRDPQHFRAAVESVRAQSYEPIEVVVVDDSPEDVSAWLEGETEGFAAVRRLRDGVHDGPAAARNAGIRASSGAFVAFLDDDDTWAPGKISRQVDRFRDGDDREPGIVLTGLRRMRDGEVVSYGRSATAGDVTEAILVGRPFTPFSTAMVRATAADRAGPIDERLRYMEDREWYLRLSQHCRFATIGEPLVDYRLGDHERLTRDYEAVLDGVELLIEKHRSTAAAYGQIVERRFISALTRTLVPSALRAGEYADARRYAIRALRAYPLDPDCYAYLFAALGGRWTYRAAQRANRAANRFAHRLRRTASQLRLAD